MSKESTRQRRSRASTWTRAKTCGGSGNTNAAKRAIVKIQSVQANVPASSELRSEAPSSIVEAEMHGLQSRKFDRAEKTEPALDPRSSARASPHLLLPSVKPRVRARLESRADAIQETASASITSRSVLGKCLTLLAPQTVEMRILGAKRPWMACRLTVLLERAPPEPTCQRDRPRSSSCLRAR